MSIYRLQPYGRAGLWSKTSTIPRENQEGTIRKLPSALCGIRQSKEILTQLAKGYGRGKGHV